MHERILTMFITILLWSCASNQSKTTTSYGMTTLESFDYNSVAEKYNQVVPISPDDLHGLWETLGSYFTVVNQDIKTTLGLEGRIYEIKANGDLVIDNTALGFDKKSFTWSLSENNTVFNDNLDGYRIRIYNDTMEWIAKSDKDYIYIILARR